MPFCDYIQYISVGFGVLHYITYFQVYSYQCFWKCSIVRWPPASTGWLATCHACQIYLVWATLKILQIPLPVKSTVDFLINSSFFHLHLPAFTPQVERQKMEANINLPTREYSFLTIQTIQYEPLPLPIVLYVSRIVMNKRGNYRVSVTAICCFLKIVYHFSVFTLTACCSLLFWK